MNEVSTIISPIFLKKLIAVRKNGQVHNFEDAKRCIFLTNNKLETIKVI